MKCVHNGGSRRLIRFSACGGIARSRGRKLCNFVYIYIVPSWYSLVMISENEETDKLATKGLTKGKADRVEFEMNPLSIQHNRRKAENNNNTGNRIQSNKS